MPISEKTAEYAQRVFDALKAAGLRAGIDASNDRIQGKVKVAADEKIPYMAIVGPRDAEAGTVSVRVRGTEKDLGAMPLDAFVAQLREEYALRRAELGVKP
jgi:threonyl-tRNA synthetase